MAKFVYYNVNPKGIREEDCVTRAITLATGLDYEDIADKLYLTAELLDCQKLCMYCYRRLIEDVFKFKEVDGGGMTVEEFADLHPYGIYLIRIEGHITVSVYGEIWDIWDCRDELVDTVWEVE